MLVKRDFLATLKKNTALEVVLLWGPRQVGKTTILTQLKLKSQVFLDDLNLRTRAQHDPAFFLDDLKKPCLIDEVQYAPLLFSQIKLIVDQTRRKNLNKKQKQSQALFFLTGSNKTLLDKNVKESLAGRCHLFHLHAFSVKEIIKHFPDLHLKEILFKGSFPEVYTRNNLKPQRFYDDYILSFIQKDVAFASGIQKIDQFQTILKLLAARSGQFLNLSELSRTAGVDQKTIAHWIAILKQNAIIELVEPFTKNLSKRVVKMKKLYFYDTGLCARLQGHTDAALLWNSVFVGPLFETLVFSEIIKTKDNFLKDWHLFTWRTKDQNEIDFILETSKGIVLIEVKLSLHKALPINLDREAQKEFKKIKTKIVVVAFGEVENLDSTTKKVPIFKLGEYLLKLNL